MSIRLLRTALSVVALTCLTRPAQSQSERQPPSVRTGGGASRAAPLTLGAVLDSVIRNHPMLKAADAQVRAADGSRRTAGAFGNPMLSYQVENTAFPGGHAPAGMDRESMWMATLPLEPLFQRSPRVKQAEAGVRAAEADRETARAALAMDAAHAYHRVALAQVEWETASELAKWFDTVVAYDRSRVQEGAAAEADLIRSQNERERALIELTMREAELARARADLVPFLGDPRQVSRDFLVVIEGAPMTFPANNVGTSLRSEVRAARERADAAARATSLERVMTIRQVGATVGLKQTAGTSSMIAGISLPFPIFDANRGAIQRAAAERDAATFELAAIERSTTADVAGAFDVARLLTDRTVSLVQGGTNGFLARADESRRIALGAYREGATPLLQVIDAARAWGEARSTFYQLLYAQHESVLALMRAQGTDLFTAIPNSHNAGVPR